jgi:putative transposase
MIQQRHRSGECTLRNGCEALDVSESGYYDWLRRQAQEPGSRARQEATLTRQIADLHRQSGKAYGSPRIHAALKAQGVRCSKHRVARLMRKAGIRSLRARKVRRVKTTNSNHGLPVSRNLLGRDFTATAPDKKWVADVTYIPTEQGWLYLAVILDLFSRKVVGWAAAQNFNRDLVCHALRNALVTRKTPQMLHSDRGVQYASDAYQSLLTTTGIQCSMSRRGDCYDNAVAESFFASLKSEIGLPRTGFVNPQQAKRKLFAYIEDFYNRRRLHSSLGYKSPVNFEMQQQQLSKERFA